MIFPVKRVKEELINEFAVSNMDIENFQPDAQHPAGSTAFLDP